MTPEPPDAIREVGRFFADMPMRREMCCLHGNHDRWLVEMLVAGMSL